MKNFAYSYYGHPKFETQEAGAEHMAKWQAWMGGLGDAVANPGWPLGTPMTVSSEGVTNGGGSNPLTGFTIVKAESIEAAVELTKGCPHLDHGTIEVAEALDMEM